jgi:phosphoglycolate phosphatase
MKMPMIKAIVFDKDGTLFDFRQSWGKWAADFLAHLTTDVAEQHRLGAVIGYDPVLNRFAPDSPVIAATPSEIAAFLAPHYPQNTADQLEVRMNLLAAEAAMAPAVPLRPLLSALRARGLQLGVATNDGAAPAVAHLERAGVADLFDLILGSDSGYGGKPCAGMLTAFATHVGHAPGVIAMVGDSRHDLQAARAAGMVAVAVLTGVATADDLAPLADAVLPDIGALPDWLDRA